MNFSMFAIKRILRVMLTPLHFQVGHWQTHRERALISQQASLVA